MAARPRNRAVAGERLTVPSVDDEKTSRALDALADAVRDLQARARRVVLRHDLVLGTNRVPHGLGRAPKGFSVTKTTTNATFDAALSSEDNPRPDLEIWIEVVGVAMPGAIIEVF